MPGDWRLSIQVAEANLDVKVSKLKLISCFACSRAMQCSQHQLIYYIPRIDTFRLLLFLQVSRPY